MALQTVESKDPRKITICSSATFFRPVADTISVEWRDLDRLLVLLWKSRSILPKIKYSDLQTGREGMVGDILCQLYYPNSRALDSLGWAGLNVVGDRGNADSVVVSKNIPATLAQNASVFGPWFARINCFVSDAEGCDLS